MTGLRSALERYLSMRQGLGYKYQHQARRLSEFVSFMEKHKATTITTKLAVVLGQHCRPIGTHLGRCG